MVIVDVEPGIPASVRNVPLSAGRRLVRARGEWSDLNGREDLREAYLDLVVETAGPDPALADRVHDEFDFVVKVKAEYPREEVASATREHKTLAELYADYYTGVEGVAPDDGLMAAFREILEEVGGAPA